MNHQKRVVVTGIGIVSPIGNNQKEVKESLYNNKSGINFCKDYSNLGFRSHIHGDIDIDFNNFLEKKDLRFMGDGAAYTAIAMKEAISDANLSDELVSNSLTGLIAGAGGPSTFNLRVASDLTREKGPKRVGPFMVPRCMSSNYLIGTNINVKAYIDNNNCCEGLVDFKECIETSGHVYWGDYMLLQLLCEILKVNIGKIDGKFETEASGNIGGDNLVSYAETGVDYVSMGALTYAAIPVDLSLKAV